MCFALSPLVGVREEGLQSAPGHPVGEKYEGLRTVACRPLPCAMKNIFFCLSYLLRLVQTMMSTEQQRPRAAVSGWYDCNLLFLAFVPNQVKLKNQRH